MTKLFFCCNVLNLLMLIFASFTVLSFLTIFFLTCLCRAVLWNSNAWQSENWRASRNHWENGEGENRVDICASFFSAIIKPVLKQTKVLLWDLFVSTKKMPDIFVSRVLFVWCFTTVGFSILSTSSWKAGAGTGREIASSPWVSAKPLSILGCVVLCLPWGLQRNPPLHLAYLGGTIINKDWDFDQGVCNYAVNS